MVPTAQYHIPNRVLAAYYLHIKGNNNPLPHEYLNKYDSDYFYEMRKSGGNHSFYSDKASFDNKIYKIYYCKQRLSEISAGLCIVSKLCDNN